MIKFYKTKGQYGAFSNFSRHPIYAGGKIWPTSEHYFQAMKFEDEDLQEAIRLLRKPSEAAATGRNRHYTIREGWDEIHRARTMMVALRAKFTQHPDLKVLLVDTGVATIVEHTANDSYWGDGGDGSGQNMLGKLLMQLRGQLREECICHETTHGKVSCPVHGKHPAKGSYRCPKCSWDDPSKQPVCVRCGHPTRLDVAPDPLDIEPDWTKKCIVCGESPVLPTTEMCGPCSFGDAETVGGNW